MLFSLDEPMMTPQQKLLIQHSTSSLRILLPAIAWFCLYKACLGFSCWTCSLSLPAIPQAVVEAREASVLAASGTNMKSARHGAVIGIPVAYLAEEVPGKPVCDALSSRIVPRSYGSSQLKKKRADAVIGWMNKFSKKADSYAQGLKEHVRLGPKIADTLKGKLNLGARILQAGGVERAFRQIFGARDGEKLLRASQCYLSTTAGPIAGMLFISTEKIAFHSDRSLAITSPGGEVVRIPYKVMIPLRKIKRANPSENVNKPSQKYIQIATVDDFEFWFMGFVSYNRSVKCVQKACCFAQ